jgi:hypothetical protein
MEYEKEGRKETSQSVPPRKTLMKRVNMRSISREGKRRVRNSEKKEEDERKKEARQRRAGGSG